MVKQSKSWCDICRDEDPDLFCSIRGCRRKFHVDCLRNTNQFDPDEDLEEFTCQRCKAEEEVECYRCHKLKDGATLLICDVCNRGAHIDCAGLKEEPQTDEWICSVCSPNQANVKTTMTSVAGGRPKLGNVDICYVCQKGGKLLCCDSCDQSFHPKCIDPEFLELTLKDDTEDQKWCCPICRGQDPLKNMGHKRMTKTERQKRSAEWQKCVKSQSRLCRSNRDKFLWDCRSALKPFVSVEVMKKIQKSAKVAISAEKVELKQKPIPKKIKPQVLVPRPPAVPFKRTTSTSLRAAVGPEELEERRPLKRLRKNPEAFNEGSAESSRKNSMEDVDAITRGVTRRSSESGTSEVETGGHAKRRRLTDSDDDSKIIYSEVPKERINSECRTEKLEEREGEKLESETDLSNIEFDQFKMKEENEENQQKNTPVENHQIPTSECDVEGILRSSEDLSIDGEPQLLRPIATTSITTTATTIIDTVPDETENSTVSYQCDTLLKEAEEKAIKKSVEILREGILLKNYQRWGVNWLLDAYENKAGAILADEMGLGKTIQTLVFLSALKCRGITGPHLVVVPLSTVGNWAREIRRFTPQLTFTKICGSRQEREYSMGDGVAADGIYDIFITTYETCVTEEWFFTDQFKWQCVILDEAHRIKNESARIRHSLDRVDCNMRVLLTGTPLQNNIKELLTLLNFLFPDVISSSDKIEAAFQSNLKHQSSTQKLQSSSAGDDLLLDNPAEFDERKIGAITGLLSKLMLRRTKDLVVRLPKKIEHDIWLPLSPSAATWYRRLLEITADVDHSSIRKLLGTVIKMRICCCHPRGLVSRPAQLQTFTDNLKTLGWPELELSQVMEESKKLKEEQGWTHVLLSSKLIFLDKLLRQLHFENMEHCKGYKEEYEYGRSNQLRKAIQERKEKLEGLMSDSKSWELNQASEQRMNEDVVRAIENLGKELKILEQGEESGGNGLNGLSELSIEDGIDSRHIAFGRPSTNESMFVKYLYPWDSKFDKESDVIRSDSIQLNGEEHTRLEVPIIETISDGGSTTTTTLPNCQPLLGECSEDVKTPSIVYPHKVLIFTQFQLVLNELESYCIWRGWSYMRLDGSTNKMIRELDTREFNNNDSNHFIYLISTRAGGLGINLVTANHVVLFDEDWNPFVDLQAVDRAHRIGQIRNVLVWKLMTEWTVEERMAIRRQQKLKLDKLLIQANVENLEETEGELGTSDEKLSTEEIRRLIQYGRTALMEVSFESGVESVPLEMLLSRKRRDLKEVAEGKALGSLDETPSNLQSSPSEVENDVQVITNELPLERSIAKHSRESISLKEALDEEEDDTIKIVSGDLEAEDETGLERQKTKDDSTEQDSPTDSVLVEGDRAFAAALEEQQVKAVRPKRERKKPKMLYNPMEWKDKPKIERKLVRERYCFRCGDSGSQVQDSYGRKNDRPSSDADPLVGCMRCPKVYHQHNCLGLDKMPSRSWMCPWHECCVCFRRSGAAGGLLIHCAECPTAFCFDCFPPEYRRYIPPPQYYEGLQKRGWPVTPQKFITFLCSRCKALKEQERRRKLSKQQLEVENKSRKNRDDSAREETRKTQKAAKEAKQKVSDEKKLFLAAKRAIDENDRTLEKDLKLAFEGLYPIKYLELIQVRRKGLTEKQKSATKEEAIVEIASDAEEHTQHSGDESQEKSLPKVVEQKAAAKKRFAIPERLKNPSDILKMCENCFLPRHSTANCPFPREVVKQQALPKCEVTAPMPIDAPIPIDGPKSTQAFIELSDSGSEAASRPAALSVDPTAPSPTTATMSVKTTRGKTRTICAKCMNATRPHSRKHCELLTDEEKKEYVNRRSKVKQLVTLLRDQKGTIKPMSCLEQIYYEPNFDPMSVDEKILDQAKRHMSTLANSVLERAMHDAGLGNVLTGDPRKTSIQTKEKKGSLIKSTGGKDAVRPEGKQSASSIMSSVNCSIKKFLEDRSQSSSIAMIVSAKDPRRASTSESDLSSSESALYDGRRVRLQDSTSSDTSLQKKRKLPPTHEIIDQNRPLKRSRLDDRETPSRDCYSSMPKIPSVVHSYPSHQIEQSRGRQSTPQTTRYQQASVPNISRPPLPLDEDTLRAALRVFATQPLRPSTNPSSNVRRISPSHPSPSQQSSSPNLLQQSIDAARALFASVPTTTPNVQHPPLTLHSSPSSHTTSPTACDSAQPYEFQSPANLSSQDILRKSFNNADKLSVYIDIDSDSQSTKS